MLSCALSMPQFDIYQMYDCHEPREREQRTDMRHMRVDDLPT